MKPISSVGSQNQQDATLARTPAMKKEIDTTPRDRVELGDSSSKRGWIHKGINSVMSGIGLASGSIGGGLLGASVASVGATLQGLLASGFSWSALGAAGLTGGVVGATLMGIAGAYGGWALTDKVVELVKKGVGKVKNQG